MKEPRAPLTVEIMQKGQGAIQEPIPEPPAPVDPVITVASAPPPVPMTAFTVRLPVETYERLRRLSIHTRRGKGDLVNEALVRMLDGAGV